MKRQEKINGMVRALIETVAEKGNKMCATIVLSSFETEDGEKIGEIVAANGSILGMAAVIANAMEENEAIKTSIMMAAKFHTDTQRQSPFPLGLAALLGTMGK